MARPQKKHPFRRHCALGKDGVWKAQGNQAYGDIPLGQGGEEPRCIPEQDLWLQCWRKKVRRCDIQMRRLKAGQELRHASHQLQGKDDRNNEEIQGQRKCRGGFCLGPRERSGKRDATENNYKY